MKYNVAKVLDSLRLQLSNINTLHADGYLTEIGNNVYFEIGDITPIMTLGDDFIHFSQGKNTFEYVNTKIMASQEVLLNVVVFADPSLILQKVMDATTDIVTFCNARKTSNLVDSLGASLYTKFRLNSISMPNFADHGYSKANIEVSITLETIVN